MVSGVTKRNADTSLAVRAAWLHYAGGITQAEVAKRLKVSNATASRLIASAHESGAVKVSVVGDVADCLALAERLRLAYGLSACEVVPDLGEEGLPLRALGRAGATFLERTIENADGLTLGLGHGRTLAAAIDAMSGVDGSGLEFVSLLGGVTRNYAANPHDVMFRLAQKTGVASYCLPVPFFANTAADRDVLLAQRGVRQIFDKALGADIMVAGVGTAVSDTQLRLSGMLEAHEIEEVRAAGGVGEFLGHFFDGNGMPVRTSLDGRTVSPGLDDLSGRRVIAIAGGAEKVAPLSAVLRSGYISELIVDEATALSLVTMKRPIKITEKEAV
ncbi:putative ery operon repressor transcription regulator protein [Fulvimarina pelagi HTCC2506]|uniref:Putative ery operon repressor transcription regulator protein n=2 Tax=Fulvimarina pelagi TaxID=217511 RepID=Q0G1Q7_9HYPH|nr:sugar-binding transcriptional regulator [Fulvimarina pelagi]EAU41024.1 putative ery operon repressor transcription regulator protein [Fulvimarina pelagi HTCC2506]BAT30957.1 putative ery operon repressor transcription regulator protein [Fulvimarina pelagi]